MPLTIAIFVVTLATGRVLGVLLGFSDLEVTHVVFTTFFADFEIDISVQLIYFVGGDTTLAMQAIDILRDDFLKDVSIHEVLQGHVCLGWEGLLNRHVDVRLHWRLVQLALLFGFLNIGGLLPAPWTSLNNGVGTGPVVRNASSGAQTSASKCHHILRVLDQFNKHVDLFFEYIWLIEELHLFLVGLKCGMCHLRFKLL